MFCFFFVSGWSLLLFISLRRFNYVNDAGAMPVEDTKKRYENLVAIWRKTTPIYVSNKLQAPFLGCIFHSRHKFYFWDQTNYPNWIKNNNYPISSKLWHEIKLKLQFNAQNAFFSCMCVCVCFVRKKCVVNGKQSFFSLLPFTQSLDFKVFDHLHNDFSHWYEHIHRLNN